MTKSLAMRMLINKYGTKMAHMIHWIREVCAAAKEHRVIIFSQCTYRPSPVCLSWSGLLS